MLSSKWQAEIEKMKKEYEKMQTDFKAEEILLTEEMKKERLDTLAGREKAIKEYQKKIFGFEGMIFLKRQELMKPVQDKVFEAVEKVAKSKSLQIIFDKSGDLVMVYTNPIHDYTDYVLEELGLGDPNDTAEK
jgi:outer membrane protein